MSNTVTFRGNLKDDPDVKVTRNGNVKATMTVIENRRTPPAVEGGQWQDAQPMGWRVEAWGQLAENIAESARKGDPLVVSGTLQADKWHDRNTGEERYGQHVRAEEVGFSMRFHTVQATKNAKAAEQGQDNSQHVAQEQHAEQGYSAQQDAAWRNYGPAAQLPQQQAAPAPQAAPVDPSVAAAVNEANATIARGTAPHPMTGPAANYQQSNTAGQHTQQGYGR